VAIDEWSNIQTNASPVSEAIRRILHEWLIGEGPSQIKKAVQSALLQETSWLKTGIHYCKLRMIRYTRTDDTKELTTVGFKIFFIRLITITPVDDGFYFTNRSALHKTRRLSTIHIDTYLSVHWYYCQ